jgi:hypothetical protein
VDDLLNLLPDANDLRKAASACREQGQYEIAMRLDDAARFVAREERAERANLALRERENFLQQVAS